jgi:hypothetical protein
MRTIRGPMPLRACALMSYLALLTSVHAQTPQQQFERQNIQSPVAIDALPSGAIAVLESGGRLLLLPPNADQLMVIKETLGHYTPIDLTTARIGGEETMFVTMYWRFGSGSSSDATGLLAQYSLQGKEVRIWGLGNNPAAGVAVDTQAQVAYLGSLLRPEILRLEIRPSKAEPALLARVPSAAQLGAIALDSDQQRLFVADVSQGAIYVVDIARRNSRKLVSSLGEPAALAYDSAEHRLYVADASQRCIWVIAGDAAAPKPQVFSNVQQLRQPRGLAIGPGHRLWVADTTAGILINLNASGQIVRTISH